VRVPQRPVWPRLSRPIFDVASSGPSSRERRRPSGVLISSQASLCNRA
jgi:hypothetical protein